MGNILEVAGCGCESAVEQIRPGFAADVTAVEGDPIDNVSVIEDVRFVMRDGRVARAR